MGGEERLSLESEIKPAQLNETENMSSLRKDLHSALRNRYGRPCVECIIVSRRLFNASQEPLCEYVFLLLSNISYSKA